MRGRQMHLFKWSSALRTGIAVIDEQHRELIARVNRFLKRCVQDGCPREELAKTFGYLRGYSIVHFTLEEELMAEYGFPGAEAHRNAHVEFRDWVERTAPDLARRPLNVDDVLKLNYTLVDHLEQHFRVVDRKLTDYLKSVARQRPDAKLLELIKGVLGRDA